MNWRTIRMAKHMAIKVKLTFIGYSGSNHSAFYLYWATGCRPKQQLFVIHMCEHVMCGKVRTLQYCCDQDTIYFSAYNSVPFLLKKTIFCLNSTQCQKLMGYGTYLERHCHG